MPFESLLRHCRENPSTILLAMLAGVVAAILFVSYQLSLLSSEALELDLQAHRLAARLAAQPAAPEARPVSLLPSLPAFNGLLGVTADTQKLFNDAGLSLRDSSHVPLPAGADDNVGRVDVVVRAKGNYTAMKKAIAALLARHPELALTSLTLSRDQAADPAPQIEAHFTFFHSRQT